MSRVCHVHGDTFAACKGQPHPGRTLWCDGQGEMPSRPQGAGEFYASYARKYWPCRVCGKVVGLRKDGAIRAHNGRGK